ncbi:hypothetical protein NHX12_031288 [Muraenolepis orangiensis]|uniref:Uncharacterized protein n=1 Tax=Muraenolepis orangiensis TaxID=630683 RepID=A0A9Q0E774_9TELE|nr:hypothetical protein NHX12_031288 [Muraenolepis orangiensis]
MISGQGMVLVWGIQAPVFSGSLGTDVSQAADDVVAEVAQLGQGQVIGHLCLIVTMETSSEVGTLVGPEVIQSHQLCGQSSQQVLVQLDPH